MFDMNGGVSEGTDHVSRAQGLRIENSVDRTNGVVVARGIFGE